MANHLSKNCDEFNVQRIHMQLKHVNSYCSRDLSRFQQLTKVACIKLNEHYRGYKLYVIGIVLDIPSLYLGEVCQRIHDDLSIDISPSLICGLLKWYGITRKIIRQVAKQRCDNLRGACVFMSQMFLLNRQQLV